MLTREGLERLTRNVRFTGSLRRKLRRLVEFRAGRGCGKISSDIYHWMPNGGRSGGGPERRQGDLGEQGRDEASLG